MTTRLTTAQVYALTRKAGFSASGAVLMTAIVAAESANNPSSIGDVNLTEPGEKSVGLAQINYRPSRDKGSAARDPSANLDPLTNLQHAYAISGQGSRFTPWSTFTNGAYTKFLGGASTAAGQPLVAIPSTTTGGAGASSTGATAQQVGLGGDITGALGAVGSFLGGVATAPLGWAGSFLGAGLDNAKAALVADFTKSAIYISVVLGGVALVVIGAQQTVAPVMNKARDSAGQAAQLAALAAV